VRRVFKDQTAHKVFRDKPEVRARKVQELKVRKVLKDRKVLSACRVFKVQLVSKALKVFKARAAMPELVAILKRSTSTRTRLIPIRVTD